MLYENEHGVEIELQNQDRDIYRRLKKEAEKFNIGDLEVLVASTALNILDLISEDHTLFADVSNPNTDVKKIRIKFPFDTHEFEQYIPAGFLEECYEEGDFSIETVKISGPAYKVLESAKPKYEELKANIESKMTQACVDEIFIYGVRILGDLCRLSKQGFKFKEVIRNIAKHKKNSEPYRLDAEILLERIREYAKTEKKSEELKELSIKEDDELASLKESLKLPLYKKQRSYTGDDKGLKERLDKLLNKYTA